MVHADEPERLRGQCGVVSDGHLTIPYSMNTALLNDSLVERKGGRMGKFTGDVAGRDAQNYVHFLM